MTNFEQNVGTAREWLGEGSINIFGMPFAGKDTQSHEVSAQLGLDGRYLSSGQVLRDLKASADLPDRVRDIMDSGALIPVADFVQYVTPHLMNFAQANQPLVLSSVGRFNGEQHGVLELMEQTGHTTKAVILLTIDRAIAEERWRNNQLDVRGVRADDSVEAFDTRFREFEEKSMPVIEFYRNLGLLDVIDGGMEKHAVTEAIFAALAARALASRVSASQ